MFKVYEFRYNEETFAYQTVFLGLVYSHNTSQVYEAARSMYGNRNFAFEQIDGFLV
jgi:hypothetical protein